MGTKTMVTMRNLAMVATLMLAACETQPPAGPPQANMPQPPGISGPATVPKPQAAPTGNLLFAETGAGLNNNVTSTQFNFVTLRDLWVRTVISGMPPSTPVVLHLVFSNPLGEAFYHDNVPFGATPGMTPMQMPGAMYPSDVRTATVLQTGGYALDRAVPIAGSVFQRFPSDGDWTVQATVDGVSGTFEAKFHVENHR